MFALGGGLHATPLLRQWGATRVRGSPQDWPYDVSLFVLTSVGWDKKDVPHWDNTDYIAKGGNLKTKTSTAFRFR